MKNNIHEILLEIESIKNILESMDQSKTISSIEYDQAMDKMRNVYGMMSEVNKFKETINIESVSELVEIKILAKLSEVIDTIIERKIKSLNLHSPEAPVEKEKPAPIIKEVEKQPEIIVKEDKKTATTQENKAFHEALAEKKKPSKSIYDVLSKEVTPVDASAKTVGQSIPDLEKAISLNEKFVFIKELFGGNAQKYSLSISKLNSMSGMAEAMNYISSNFPEWNMNDNNVKLLIELIKRRYL